MISEQTKKILSEIHATPYGRALEEFIEDQLTEFNKVQLCKSWDEVLGKQYAILSFEKLFSYIRPKPTAGGARNIYT